MEIYEYQAKRLLSAYGVPVPPSHHVTTVDAAIDAATDLGFPVFVKAQIHGGRRSGSGGVRRAERPGDVRDAADALLGHRLVTPQTGPAGLEVHSLLVEKAMGTVAEVYLAITVDRSKRSVAVLASRSGGATIEQTARSDPGAFATEWVDPGLGLRGHQTARLVRSLNLRGPNASGVSAVMQELYRLLVDKDCSLVEVNPLALTSAETVCALDAKIAFDPNGVRRHPDLLELRDVRGQHRLEARAAAANLDYIHLDGTVGCLVNGAGLALATMDLIESAGAAPACFLDIGGGATQEMVEAGAEILFEDPATRVILINVFGGIVRCDVVAHGVIAAARRSPPTVPVIVRLDGTNADAGRALFAASTLRYVEVSDLGEAAACLRRISGETP